MLGCSSGWAGFGQCQRADRPWPRGSPQTSVANSARSTAASTASRSTLGIGAAHSWWAGMLLPCCVNGRPRPGNTGRRIPRLRPSSPGRAPACRATGARGFGSGRHPAGGGGRSRRSSRPPGLAAMPVTVAVPLPVRPARPVSVAVTLSVRPARPVTGGQHADLDIDVGGDVTGDAVARRSRPAGRTRRHPHRRSPPGAPTRPAGRRDALGDDVGGDVGPDRLQP
jgi:hypothetical protein